MASLVGSFLSFILHPEEAYSLLSLKRRSMVQARNLSPDPNWQFCYEFLNKVSRSFAMVIMELGEELRNPICVFYLILRGLDTVEDDTRISPKERAVLCKDFYKVLRQKGWHTEKHGCGAEKELLKNFHIVIDCFGGLAEPYQNVIVDITQRMGSGMAKYISSHECKTVSEYDEYCYYVAGLVGIGLTRMFAVVDAVDPTFCSKEYLSNSMGLFLQKTNIIRDYLEDIEEGRTFWPREIWELYASKLEDFKDPANMEGATRCLNHLVTDALRHVPDCLEYLAGAKDPKVFNFVSIPQVMAIATLAECYDNPKVFCCKVKVRRGVTAKLVMKSTNMKNIYQIFYRYAVSIRDRIPPQDPNASQTRQALDTIIAKCMSYVPVTPDLTLANRVSLLLFAVLSAYLLHRRKENAGEGTIWRRGGVPQACDVLAVVAFFAVMIYLLTFFGLQFVKPQYNSESTN